MAVAPSSDKLGLQALPDPIESLHLEHLHILQMVKLDIARQFYKLVNFLFSLSHVREI